MPYEILRTSGMDPTTKRRRACYTVRRASNEHQRNPRAFSKCTTLTKARAQERLLRALHYNPNFKRIQKTRKNPIRK